jgi:hypothetical protein
MPNKAPADVKAVVDAMLGGFNSKNAALDRNEAQFLRSMTVPSANRAIAWTRFPAPRLRAKVFIICKGSTRLAAIAEAVPSTRRLRSARPDVASTVAEQWFLVPKRHSAPRE